MATGINRLPRGLLSYLDMQAQGNNPSQLADTVQPVIDLEPFYRSMARYEYRLAVGTVAITPGVGAVVQIPTDQIWLVHQISSTVTNNTAGNITTFQHFPYTFEHGSAAIIPLAPVQGYANLLSPPQSSYCAGSFPDPFVAIPGSTLGVCISSGTWGAGVMDVTLSIIFQRLEV